MDLVLIGDSTGVTSLGLESTVGVTLDEIIYHCKSVARGAKSPFILGDLPLGTYEKSPEFGMHISCGSTSAPRQLNLTQLSSPAFALSKKGMSTA